MIDEEFEKAAVSWLASRGYLIQKLEPVEVQVENSTVKAWAVPIPAETPSVVDLMGALEDSIAKARESRLNRPESRFEEFWALYPRKTGKEAARKIFEKLAPMDQDLAIMGLKSHLRAEAFSPEKCYIKHPSTWLNQKVYLDEPEKRSWKKPQVGGKTEKRKALDDWLSE